MARCLTLLSLMLASFALAAPNPKATALAKDAERLYKDGQYKDAAKVLEQALQLEPNPKLLYNMARAWDQAGELQSALDAYRKYVGLPAEDTEPDLVKKANLSMDRIRQLLARQEADSRVRDAEKDRLEKDARDARARADAEAERARKQKADFEARERAQAEAAQSKASGRMIAAFVVGGVGVVGLGLGLVFGLMSNGSRQAFRTATLVEDKRARQADTIGQAIVADVSLAVGVACAVTAIILFPKGEPEAQLTFTPLPGGALGAFTWSF
ncbi:MAG: tetratricopeptide repeat protein [Myxococcaceae bacterium]|nr:tetratricopeptide repeat protein [Myxococcaceae bacterium]